MKILTFSHSGDAVASITDGRNAALRALGHEVLCIDMERTPLSSAAAYGALASRILSFGPDWACFYGFTGLVTVIDDDGRSVPLLEKLRIPFAVLVSNLGSLQTKGLGGLMRFRNSPFMRLFVWDRFYAKTLSLMGFKNVSYLALASSPEKFFRIASPDVQTRAALARYGCDVSFCGNSGNANFVRERCMNGAPAADELDFLVGESFNFAARAAVLSAIRQTRVAYYGRVANPGDYGKNFSLRGWLDPEELNLLYNASRIVLNIFHPLVREAVPMRVFDAMAAGAMVVSDRRWVTEETFAANRDIVYFDHPRELDAIFGHYLAHEDERRAIAESGMAAVLENHTWTHRMGELARAMQSPAGAA